MSHLTLVPKESAAEAATAAKVLEYHGKTFHFASQLLEPQVRLRATRLYAFCRYTDDLADQASDPDQARRRLLGLRRELTGGPVRSPQASDLIKLAGETGMNLNAAVSLIDGVLSDLDLVQIDSERQLIRYSYRVAGTVGLMMCAMLRVRRARALPFAVDLGIAMQLTNIARDVGADAALGRVYLPASWIGKISPEQVLDPGPEQAQRLREATRRLLNLAETYYASGTDGLRYLPGSARRAIVVAASVYRAIGGRIAAAEFQAWDRRAVVSRPRKITTGLGALTRHTLTRMISSTDPVHDAALHDHLEGLDILNRQPTEEQPWPRPERLIS